MRTLCLIFVTVLGLVHARDHFPDYSKYKTHPDVIAFTEVDATHIYDAKADEHTQTYRSQAMPLTNGDTIFTSPPRTLLKMPTGSVAIRSFHAEVVDDAGDSVPLSEVYNHHWLVFAMQTPNAGACGARAPYLTYMFGASQDF